MTGMTDAERLDGKDSLWGAPCEKVTEDLKGLLNIDTGSMLHA